MRVEDRKSSNFVDMTWAHKYLMEYWKQRFESAKTDEERQAVIKAWGGRNKAEHTSSVSNPVGFQDFWRMADPERDEELLRFKRLNELTRKRTLLEK